MEKEVNWRGIRKTEKALRKLADKKTESIERTAEWINKYYYTEWPAKPDQFEQRMKNKITTTLPEGILREPAFMAWILYQVVGEHVENLEVKAI